MAWVAGVLLVLLCAAVLWAACAEQEMYEERRRAWALEDRLKEVEAQNHLLRVQNAEQHEFVRQLAARADALGLMPRAK